MTTTSGQEHFTLLERCLKKISATLITDISRDMFANGYTLYGFDLTSDDCSGEGVHLIRNVSVAIEGTFKAPIGSTLSAVFYSEYDELVQLREDRSIERLSGI